MYFRTGRTLRESNSLLLEDNADVPSSTHGFQGTCYQAHKGCGKPKKVRLIKEIVATTKGAPIEGRIRSKDTIKNWQTGTGTGKLFSFVLGDTTGEIGALVVDDKLDKWNDLLHVGKCFRISNYGTRKSDEKYKKTEHECFHPKSKNIPFM